MEGGSSSAKLTWSAPAFQFRGNVDVAQIYDGFSASVIYGSESYGFCKGRARPSISSRTDISSLDGEIAAAQHVWRQPSVTGRIHGLWHVIEGAPAGHRGPRRASRPGRGTPTSPFRFGASAPIVTRHDPLSFVRRGRTEDPAPPALLAG